MLTRKLPNEAPSHARVGSRDEAGMFVADCNVMCVGWRYRVP